jgi:hypothetical protein
VKQLLTALKTIDAKITHVGPRIVITLLDVKVKVWSALLDNVKLTVLSGNLDVKLLKTVVVMLSSVMKDTAGVLPVSKVHKPLVKFLMMTILLPPLILLLLL